MTTRREMSKMNRMVECIRKEGRITKVQLVMKSGISISYYEKLKPYMEEIFQHSIRYDKESRSWVSLGEICGPCAGGDHANCELIECDCK